jgi:multiple sugar transport system substrate-binding protein
MTTKKLSRREFLKLSGVAAAGAVLASCGKPTPEPTVAPTKAPDTGTTVEPTQAPPTKAPASGNVVLMHRPGGNEWSEENAADFTAKYPDITVELVKDDPTRLFAMLAAGAPPDLYRIQAPSIPQYLARNLIYDLTPYFEASSILKMDDLASANDYYKANSPLEIGSGNIYGMCKDFSPDNTLFINTELYQQAGLSIPDDTKPLTYDEVYQNGKATLKMDGDRVVNFGYSGNIEWWLDRQMMVMLAEKGVMLYSDQYDAINIGDDAKAVIQYFVTMANENISISPRNPSPNWWGGGDIAAGILSQLQHGYWMMSSAETDTTRGKLMMLPAPTWAGERRDPTITATGMVMMAKGANHDAAWNLFEFYNGDKPAVDRSKAGWGVPALKSLVGNLPQDTDYHKQCFKVLEGELALNTPPVQFNPFIGESTVSDSYLKFLDQVLKNQITVDDLVKGVTSEVNLAIREGIDRITG